VDPICQSVVDPANIAVNTEEQSLNKWLWNGGAHRQGEGVENSDETVRRIAGWARPVARRSHCSDRGGTAPAGRCQTVGRWLDGRRQSEALAASAASALRKFKTRVFSKRFRAAGDSYQTSLRAISGFGFQVCGVTV
jgi:hypothetical protein